MTTFKRKLEVFLIFSYCVGAGYFWKWIIDGDRLDAAIVTLGSLGVIALDEALKK